MVRTGRYARLNNIAILLHTSQSPSDRSGAPHPHLETGRIGGVWNRSSGAGDQPSALGADITQPGTSLPDLADAEWAAKEASSPGDHGAGGPVASAHLRRARAGSHAGDSGEASGGPDNSRELVRGRDPVPGIESGHHARSLAYWAGSSLTRVGRRRWSGQRRAGEATVR